MLRIEASLDAAQVGQRACRRIFQRLPGPVEDLRIIARNPQKEMLHAVASGVTIEVTTLSGIEQRLKCDLSPAAQGAQHALRVVGLRRERIAEKVLEIPAQLARQI